MSLIDPRVRVMVRLGNIGAARVCVRQILADTPIEAINETERRLAAINGRKTNR
ncbi:hypothetical protein ACFSOZ_12710 [Mesorhizobium newzealandense]|uniref:Uncharacterized protein n=1 Tax=Mesorhizobium newzealandense TaxID=1300302 RepID=A0ABW4UBE1_9HYPH